MLLKGSKSRGKSQVSGDGYGIEKPPCQVLGGLFLLDYCRLSAGFLVWYWGAF